MNKTSRFEMRIESDLKDWLSDYARSTGRKDAQVVRDLLFALRDGRLIVTPPGPQAFPAETSSLPGESLNHPILVAFPDHPNQRD